MKRPSVYWICQIVGWGIAVIYWSRYQVVFADDKAWGLVSVLVMLIPGIGATHLYKIIAHKRNWLRFDLLKLLPILLISLLVLSSFYFFVGFVSTHYIFGPQNVDALLGMGTGGVRYMAIWLLAFHLYHYGLFRKQAEIDQKRFENLAIQAQYRKLNAELNPHFLFNSLNSIKALTRENPETARNAIDLLSNMLRASLKISKEKTISITEEINRINNYIQLEKIRFEDRLKYTIEMEDGLENIEIPPLIIYNLVENAVVHNLSLSNEGVRIKVSIFQEKNRLILEVKNTGRLDLPINYGTGLQNIKERLKLLYSDHSEFTIGQEGEEVCAKIEIELS